MSNLYLLLGSNMGNSPAILGQACEVLSNELGDIIHASKIYLSDAWGIEDQPVFYNQALQLSVSALAPTDILAVTQQVEQRLGRLHHPRWSSRVIDIDILYFDDLVVETERLTIPHKYLPYRNFALVPLCEIAPNFVHPGLLKTNRELLQESTDSLAVRLYKE